MTSILIPLALTFALDSPVTPQPVATRPPLFIIR